VKCNCICLNPEVLAAQKNNLPIVALESTIIAHGMPFPQNLQTALKLENIVRQHNCCPATVFLYNGSIMIGAEREHLEYLARTEGVQKVTTRDIARALIDKKCGAATVAATMFCAHLAGIKVLATGGIGGVHRNAADSFDISADLTELKRTPIIVVSAGAKAILDIPKTLEYLETAGVPVLGWQTDKFPGFYSAQTPWWVEKIESSQKIAEIYKKQQELNIQSGILVANPVPVEKEIPWSEIKLIIDQALDDLQLMEFKGKAVTPFLLSRIAVITGGRSLQTNISLVKNNVELACRIAGVLIDG
jgi:pseudouridylate synthase